MCQPAFRSKQQNQEKIVITLNVVHTLMAQRALILGKRERQPNRKLASGGQQPLSAAGFGLKLRGTLHQNEYSARRRIPSSLTWSCIYAPDKGEKQGHYTNAEQYYVQMVDLLEQTERREHATHRLIARLQWPIVLSEVVTRAGKCFLIIVQTYQDRCESGCRDSQLKRQLEEIPVIHLVRLGERRVQLTRYEVVLLRILAGCFVSRSLEPIDVLEEKIELSSERIEPEIVWGYDKNGMNSDGRGKKSR